MHINRLYLQKADIAELVRWYLQFNWILQITFGDIEENIDTAVLISNIEIENWFCKQLRKYWKLILELQNAFLSIVIKQDIAKAIFSKLKVILILKEKKWNIDIDIASGFWWSHRPALYNLQSIIPFAVDQEYCICY